MMAATTHLFGNHHHRHHGLPAQKQGKDEAHSPNLQETLDELYKGDFDYADEEQHDEHDRWSSYRQHPRKRMPMPAQRAADINLKVGPGKHDPSIIIHQIIAYLRDHDKGRDVNWQQRFGTMVVYLEEAKRQMIAGELGYEDPDLRAALFDALVMVKTHLHFEKSALDQTPWTDEIMKGQSTQKRLLTYPHAFPQPEPSRAPSQYRPVKPKPHPSSSSVIWDTTLRLVYPDMPALPPKGKSTTDPWDPTSGKDQTYPPVEELHPLTEVDNFVQSENKFFQLAQEAATQGGQRDDPLWSNVRFGVENSIYERCIGLGVGETCSVASPPPTLEPTGSRGPNNPDGHKGPIFYNRRGWQRAALQQCLNLFTSHENRVINTPWRRLVLPSERPVKLPKDIAYIPRVLEPSQVPEEAKDPFAWLRGSLQYSQILNSMAAYQRKSYMNEHWANFSTPALPVNFRGPRIYRGLAVYDQHWLAIGDYLEQLESKLHDAWTVAPRPFLRAVLRDIDAGRQENTGGFTIDRETFSPFEDEDDREKKRFWRRDIKRRSGIDNQEKPHSGAHIMKQNQEKHDDSDYKLLDEFDIGWLRFLAEPSRTLEMCDASQVPEDNLVLIFDAKLQSYFRSLEISGHPDSTALDIWKETSVDVDDKMRDFKPKTLKCALAYINGCGESELAYSGNPCPVPGHSNTSYQFSEEEAEYLCIRLQQMGRCTYIPGRRDWRGKKGEPARIDRPSYMVHPEDRVRWRYHDSVDFRQNREIFVDEMLEHYDQNYGQWSIYLRNKVKSTGEDLTKHTSKERIYYTSELEWMLDHAGPDFPFELVAKEIEDVDNHAKGDKLQRKHFIKKHIIPEVMYATGVMSEHDLEFEKASPYWEDLATWENTGEFVTAWEKAIAANQPRRMNEPYHPKTPEKTVQFFRNLAYRMGRTLRHVKQIKDRLQYLVQDPPELKPSRLLDLSPKPLHPRPVKSLPSFEESPVIARKWWHAISFDDYELAVDRWDDAVRDGDSEVALLPPRIEDVIEHADPTSSFRRTLSSVGDPYTIIREGIIHDCVQNRPTRYPSRMSGFKDKQDKEFQGFQRPNLFEWATKEQRRFQAPHTRRNFFNMQRWPSNRMLPHRLEAIRHRKDEVLRQDPSKKDQAYGILTHRVPVGNEKPLYAHPITDHHHHHRHDEFDIDDDLWGGIREEDPDHPDSIASVDDDGTPGKDNKKVNHIPLPPDPIPSGRPETKTNQPNVDNMNRPSRQRVSQASQTQEPLSSQRPQPPQPMTAPRQRMMRDKMSTTAMNKEKSKAMSRAAGRQLVPFQRSQNKFHPGVAALVHGDTLLQRVALSQSIDGMLHGSPWWWQTRWAGLPKLWKTVTGSKLPLIPLVPTSSRANIPRSNPYKRKMPIEYLNSEQPLMKKFKFDTNNTVHLKEGGIGGQFGAAFEPEKPQIKEKMDEKEQQQFPLMILSNDMEAKKQFNASFPRGWDKWDHDKPEKDMVGVALRALRGSMNRQLRGHRVARDELKELLHKDEKSALIRQFWDPCEKEFYVEYLAYLLKVWGDKKQLKLHLGIVQEDPRKANTDPHYPKYFAKFLVGDGDKMHPNSIPIWIRLTYEEKTPWAIDGPAYKYNSYNAVRPLK
ncbi:hypothetical protein F5Y18DRAFT_70571 [Xylariaceae sp. FL1019]|nr:hypothetical protein F5Y18DRAFT_70571 [Xylariaceae sp. FL1019]